MRTEELKNRFSEIKKAEETKFYGFNHFDAPVDVLMGIRRGMPTIVFICKDEPPSLDSSRAVRVEAVKHSSLWRLYMTETDKKFDDPFCSFCLDILSVIDGATNERIALSRLEARYEVWKSFWKSVPKMTEEKVRGLAGELLFLEKCLNRGDNPHEVVLGWHGASGSDQDFVFKNAWAEVKTIRQAADTVQISSLEQLVNPAELEKTTGVNGQLIVVRLHSDPAENVFTLSQLHERIFRRLEDDPGAQQKYLTNIELTGADMVSGNLETKLPLQLMEMKFYAANAPGFPKLLREMIPTAVTKVSYTLTLSAIKDWMLEEESENASRR